MSETAKARLEVRPRADGSTALILDGQDVSGVVDKITLTVQPSGGVGMIMSLPAVTAYTESMGKVDLDDETRSLLQFMGWTAPEWEQEQ